MWTRVLEVHPKEEVKLIDNYFEDDLDTFMQNDGQNDMQEKYLGQCEFDPKAFEKSNKNLSVGTYQIKE